MLKRLAGVAIAVLGTLCAPPAGAQHVLTGSVSGYYSYTGDLNIQTPVELTGDTHITVFNGKITVTPGSSIYCSTSIAADGDPASVLSCGSVQYATPGQPGRRGFNLSLRTYRTPFASAPGTIEIGAPINLDGSPGGNGGHGSGGVFIPSPCCKVAPTNAREGGHGGLGGYLYIYSSDDVSLYYSISVKGGAGGNGGHGYGPYTGQNAAAGKPGAGGVGARGGTIKIQAGTLVYIRNTCTLALDGGLGGAGGNGDSGTICSAGAVGADGGDGGNLSIFSKYLGTHASYPGASLTIQSRGGAGGPGGNGGGGEAGDPSHLCFYTSCEDAPVVRGLAAPGGVGGGSGDGGFVYLPTNGNVTFSAGINIDVRGGGYDAGAAPPSQSGASGPAGVDYVGSCGCQVSRTPTEGIRAFPSGGNGGQILLSGKVLTIPGCSLDARGGVGPTGGRGGDAATSSPFCGSTPPGAAGGPGGLGGIGGLTSVNASSSMNGTGGVIWVCGGPGGLGGGGGCVGGPGGAGGAAGWSGWATFTGSGPRPVVNNCLGIPNGATGPTCP